MRSVARPEMSGGGCFPRGWSRFIFLRWCVLVSGFAAAACLSGQTGSADCAPRPVQCPCEYFADRYLTRATVLAITTAENPSDGTRPVTLHIEQILNPDSYLTLADTELVLTADTYVTSLNCDPTKRETPQVGDVVLAVVGYPSRAGNQLTDYSVVLMPWGDALEIGNGTAEPVSEVVKLAEVRACDERFPPPPNPCQDTQSGCSVSRAPTNLEASWSWVTLLGAATLAMVARRRRRVR